MTNKQIEKYERIFNNRINGNISDYRKGIKGLRKLDIVNFISYAQTQGTPYHATIASIQNVLEG